MQAKTEAIWQAEGTQKRAAVQRMFAEIAPTYDLLNSLMCLRMHYRWRKLAVRKLELKEGQRALDVCCGTGDFMLPLRDIVGESGRVVGVDFCLPMLQVAQQKLIEPTLSLGDACALPIASGNFDGASVGWGIRNVPDIDGAHRELFRVLKPGGRFVSLDMAQPKGRMMRGMSTWMFQRVVPFLGRLFGKTEAYTYLPKSTERFKTRAELVESMRQAGFTDVGHRDFMFGNICMHWGRKP
jgi:demethylmenaquinone methyltransferase / 2-methoxy-6-polyprenyl-1,4-benzoquinol methylase